MTPGQDTEPSAGMADTASPIAVAELSADGPRTPAPQAEARCLSERPPAKLATPGTREREPSGASSRAAPKGASTVRREDSSRGAPGPLSEAHGTTISVAKSAYLGGSAQRDGAESPRFNEPNVGEMYLKDQSQGLDNSFDGPILKAQTQMQQPGHANALEQQPPSPSIKIPSQVPSQSDLSESAQKSRPHNAKAKKKQVFVPQQDLLREHRINYREHYD